MPASVGLGFRTRGAARKDSRGKMETGPQLGPRSAAIQLPQGTTYSVELPWELNNTDYLRRVLCHVTFAMRPLYEEAVRTGRPTPPLKKHRRRDGSMMSSEDAEALPILRHILAHQAYYDKMLASPLSEADLKDHAQWLRAARGKLGATMESMKGVSRQFLEDSFQRASTLITASGQYFAIANIRDLWRTWRVHNDTKLLRLRDEPLADRAARAPSNMPSKHWRSWSGNKMNGQVSFEQSPSATAEPQVLQQSRDLDFVQQAMRAHPSSASVQESGCQAIRSITLRNQTKQVQAGRQGILEDVHKALKVHRSSATVTEAALGAVRNMTRDNPFNRALAGQLGILVDIQGAMRLHLASAALQSACCSVVQIVGHSNDIKDQAGNLGLLASVQAAMKSHQGSAAVQEEACRAVESIVSNHPGNRSRAGPQGTISDVQEAMRRHPASGGVQAAACAALHSLTFDNVNQAIAGRQGALEDIQSAMQRFRRSAPIQAAACGAVENMSADFVNRISAGRQGLLADIQAAMREHMGSAAIQAGACRAIRNMTLKIDTGAMASRKELQTAIHAAMKATHGSAFVAEEDVEQISGIHADNWTTAIRLGLLADVQAAMRSHQSSEIVQSAACSAVNTLVCTNEHRIQALARGLLADAHAAIRMHVGSAETQEQAMRVIDNLMDLGDDSHPVSTPKGLLESIKMSMLAHCRLPAVQAAACSAIYRIALATTDKEAVACLELVLDEVHNAMKAHQGSAEVQVAACRVIDIITDGDHQSRRDRAAAWASGGTFASESARRHGVAGRNSESVDTQQCGGGVRACIQAAVKAARNAMAAQEAAQGPFGGVPGETIACNKVEAAKSLRLRGRDRRSVQLPQHEDVG